MVIYLYILIHILLTTAPAISPCRVCLNVVPTRDDLLPRTEFSRVISLSRIALLLSEQLGRY